MMLGTCIHNAAAVLSYLIYSQSSVCLFVFFYLWEGQISAFLNKDFSTQVQQSSSIHY